MKLLYAILYLLRYRCYYNVSYTVTVDDGDSTVIGCISIDVRGFLLRKSFEAVQQRIKEVTTEEYEGVGDVVILNIRRWWL